MANETSCFRELEYNYIISKVVPNYDTTFLILVNPSMTCLGMIFA